MDPRQKTKKNFTFQGVTKKKNVKDDRHFNLELEGS